MNTIKALIDFMELMGYGLLVGLGIFLAVTLASVLAILVNPTVGVLVLIGVASYAMVWHVKNAPSVSFS